MCAMRADVWEYVQKHRAVRTADMGRDFKRSRQWAQQILSAAVDAGVLVRGHDRTYCLPEAVGVKVPLAPRPSKKLSQLVEALRSAGDWMMSRELLARADVSIQVLMRAMEHGLVVRQGLNWYGLPEWPDLPVSRRSNIDQCLEWLRQTGPRTPAEVYAWWSGRVSQASVTLHRMQARKLIRKVNGKYQLT